jgi:uncharacterized phiE125 gp8 family phage protein
MSGSAVPTAVVAGLVAAARELGRVPEDTEGALLARLAESAVIAAEAFCGEAIVRRSFNATLAVRAGWQRLPVAPVRAIDAVAGLSVGGVATALPVEGYAIDIDADGGGWVRVLDAGGAARVKVGYTAGCAASWGAVPAAQALGMAMLVVHLFQHREGADSEGAVPPAAMAALWRPFRRVRLMEPTR